MSYIYILLPAFHLNTTDITAIKKQCSIQFNLEPDKFELLEIPNKSNNINYGIKFKESYLSLSSIEDLIYQRNCIQSLSEKTYESLQSMSKKLNELLNSFKENGNSVEFKKDLMNDNIKLRELLVSQIEYSDNFRMNTEKTLNRIKDEFRTMVKEWIVSLQENVEDCKFLIIGNKCDLIDKFIPDDVINTKLKDYNKDKKLLYKTSALKNINISEIIEIMIDYIEDPTSIIKKVQINNSFHLKHKKEIDPQIDKENKRMLNFS